MVRREKGTTAGAGGVSRATYGPHASSARRSGVAIAASGVSPGLIVSALKKRR